MPKWLSIILGILCAGIFVSLPLLCANWKNKRKRRNKDD
nr:MAG TPA: hypothetical protein [Caudoviricetes sp.]